MDRLLYQLITPKTYCSFLKDAWAYLKPSQALKMELFCEYN